MEEVLFKARYFRVARHDLVYLKFILEAYEGLCVMSTVDRDSAVVRIGYPGTSEADVDGLMGALAMDIRIDQIPRPEGYEEGLPGIQNRKA
jgi:hypothetical protein